MNAISKSNKSSGAPNSEERDSLWALSLSDALSFRHIDIYQKCFGGYRNTLNLSPDRIRSIGLVKSRKNFEGRDVLLKKLEEVKKQCREEDIQTVTPLDKDYPPGLKNIYHPPLVLYYRGKLQKYYPDKRGSYLAIVGTRRSDTMAESVTRKLAREFTALGGHIISGMAIGIDTYAHLGALEGMSENTAGGGRSPTTAVLGCGPDIPYPWVNRRLYTRILDTGGAVISEYVPGYPPLSYNFPSRNRIISALSEAVLITQSPSRSGALITVDFALDQGRGVFVYDFREDMSGQIPERNAGNYKLIQEGATAITSLADLFDHQFGFLKKKLERRNSLSTEETTETDPILKQIYQELSSGPKTLAQLSQNLARDPIDISPLLLEGVMNGKIKEMPGKKYFLA